MQKNTKRPDVQQCIKECQDCHAICAETVTQCLTIGDQQMGPRTIAVLLDCAETCHISEDSMLRDSPLMQMLCGACAEVCDACATECERVQGDMQMKDCAARCRSCAQTCRKMATART
jgi:hypothetical protein